MIEEKKIRFSGEDNITPLMKKIRQESEQLGRELIRDARSYTTSGREVLKYLEDRIRLIEKSGEADRKSRISELDIARSKGGVSEATYKQRVSGIGAESRLEQQQVSLLREMIETIKTTSKFEITEDRKNVEKQIKSDKDLDKLGVRGDEKSSLKRLLQRDELRRLEAEEGREKKPFDRAGAELRVQRLAGSVQNIMGSENAYQATAETFGEIAKGIATKFPIIGTIMNMGAQYAGKAISASKPYEDALARISQLSGRSQQSYYGNFGGLTGMGIAPDEAAMIAMGTGQARGRMNAATIRASRNVALLNKGTGVGRETFLELERFTRDGGGGAMSGTQGLISGLQGVGAIQGKDLSLLGEYLPILANLQREQIQITGETKDKIANDLISSIAGLDQSFNNPEILKTLIPSLRSDIRSEGTPQAQAFKFSVISGMKQHRGKSYTELQEVMENAGPEEIAAIRQQIISSFGTGEAGIQAAKGLLGQSFGGKTSLARKFISGKKTTGTVEDIDFTTRAGEDYGTGDIAKSVAQFNRHFQETGIELVDKIDNLGELMIKIFDGVVEAIEDLNDSIIEDIKQRQEVAYKIDATLKSPNAVQVYINPLLTNM